MGVRHVGLLIVCRRQHGKNGLLYENRSAVERNGGAFEVGMTWWTTPGSQSIQKECLGDVGWEWSLPRQPRDKVLSRPSIIVIPGEGEERIEEFQSCSSIPPSTDHFDFVVSALYGAIVNGRIA